MSEWGTWVNLWISRIHLTRQQKNVGENYDDLASRRLIRTRSTQEFACIFLKRDLDGKQSWSPLVIIGWILKRVEQRTHLVSDGFLEQNIIQWWAFLLTALHWFYFVTFLRSLSKKLLASTIWPGSASKTETSNSGYIEGLELSNSVGQWPSQESHLFLGLLHYSIFPPVAN